MMDTYGYRPMLDVITRLIIMADTALGGDGDSHRCETTAANAMISNSHRSFSFLVMAIRDGMASAAQDDRVKWKLNAQILNQWTTSLEGKIIGMAESEHSEKTEGRGGNYDSRYLDRLEHDATSKDKKMAGMAKEIDALRQKLKNK